MDNPFQLQTKNAMGFFVSNFKWLMLVAGVLTCTMLIGLFSPASSLQSNFGDTVESNSTAIIVRNWAALIGLMGIMLIYGAFHPPVRRFALIIAGLSKLIFIILVLALGREYLNFGVGTAEIIDSILVILFSVYLLLSRSDKMA
jgi:hypothetical protein